MPNSREEEAGILYVEGVKAVSSGGHELRMLAGHLRLMIRGTSDFPGPLWRVRRIPPEGRLVELDRFADYLLRPVRVGLELPSFHVLRQILKASSDQGETTLQMVREELKRVDGLDLDEIANREHKTMLAKKTLAKHGEIGGGHSRDDIVRSAYGNSSAYLAARLARDHPALSARTLLPKTDMLHLSIRGAAIEAGIVKVPDGLKALRRAWDKASPEERDAFLQAIDR